MPHHHAPEIRVHGQCRRGPGTRFEQLQEALKPLWMCMRGARLLRDGATSAYEEEPGPPTTPKQRTQYAGSGHDRGLSPKSLTKSCMGLNELAEHGAAIEVTFYDAEFDEVT